MRILVAEDDNLSRRIVVSAVEDLGHECFEADDGLAAWTLFREQTVDVVISDWFMPGLDGLGLCERVRAAQGDRYVYFIMLTVAREDDNARQALEQGVDDFLQKPLKGPELAVRLIVAERLAALHLSVQEKQDRLMVLEEQARSRQAFEGMVGKCNSMQQIFRKIRQAAQSEVSVCFLGESGTGKELAAASIHSLSPRSGGPFLAVNCAAIPDSILESELFGHVRGAFTDAHRDKLGLFELANHGTLFLDEIGDVSSLLQKKILRVLEDRKIRPLGGEQERKLDLRVVTATNRDLQRLVANGDFREDLYYRIHVFPIQLPPLRERREDIPLLVEHFLEGLRRDSGRNLKGVAPDAMSKLVDYHWPGNIRELRNALEHGFVTVQGSLLECEDLPPDISAFTPAPPASGRQGLHQDGTEAQQVIDAVRQCDGDRTRAAQQLGISRVGLWKKIRRLGIEDEIPARRTRGG